MKLVIGNKNYSSWSMRGWLVAKLAGLDFEEIMIDLSQPNYREQLLSISSAARVPVLLIGDELVWDSLAIAEYCAELKPEIWPKETLARAIARSITAEMHSGFGALRQCMPMNLRASGRHVESNSELLKDLRRINYIWSQDGQMFPGKFLFGDTPSVADCFYAPIVSRFNTYGVLEDKHLALDKHAISYANTILTWDLYQDWASAAEREPQTLLDVEAGEVL